MPMPTLTRFSPRLSEVPVVEGIAQAGVNFFIDGQRAVAVGALEFTPVPVKVEYPWRPYYVIYIFLRESIKTMLNCCSYALFFCPTRG